MDSKRVKLSDDLDVSIAAFDMRLCNTSTDWTRATSKPSASCDDGALVFGFMLASQGLDEFSDLWRMYWSQHDCGRQPVVNPNL